MATTDKSILKRLYIVAAFLVLFSGAVLFKLVSIQIVDGEKYKALAETRTSHIFTIGPNRGNRYSGF